MKRTMLVGETGAGKNSLIRSLSGRNDAFPRPMSVEFFGPFIITPGEFLENRRFYPALITAAVDCEVLLLLQDATRSACLFPPRFATMFNRTVLGVITKIDAAQANPDRAGRFLDNAGIKEILKVSTLSGDGLEALRARLTA